MRLLRAWIMQRRSARLLKRMRRIADLYVEAIERGAHEEARMWMEALELLDQCLARTLDGWEDAIHKGKEART